MHSKGLKLKKGQWLPSELDTRPLTIQKYSILQRLIDVIRLLISQRWADVIVKNIRSAFDGP